MFVCIAFMLAHAQNNSLGPEGPNDAHGALPPQHAHTHSLSWDGPTTLQWFIHKIFYPTTTHPQPHLYRNMKEPRCEAQSFRYTWAAAYHFKQSWIFLLFFVVHYSVARNPNHLQNSLGNSKLVPHVEIHSLKQKSGNVILLSKKKTKKTPKISVSFNYVNANIS